MQKLMSRLAQFTPSFSLSIRRSYSFFSSKPGGGRFFNSTKPPKVVSSKSSKNSTRTSKTSNTEVELTSSPDAKKVEENVFITQRSSSERTPLPKHPILNLHDFQLHQFFSLHRPLLLASLPTSALFDSTSVVSAPSEPNGTSVEVSVEADAETARQLSRSLVMNRVGNVVDWGRTLGRLGYGNTNISTSEDLLSNIGMDSTKRKRRKKMKKHKLKKRRRLLRASQSRLAK